MSMNKRLKKRLQKDRPMTSISIRMPEDVLDDLKEIAPGLDSADIKRSSVSISARLFAKIWLGAIPVLSE